MIKKETTEATEAIHIAPPNIKYGEVWIKGTAPLVIHAWSRKVQNEIKAKQEAGSTANSKRKRDPKDFAEKFNEARHISFEGWDGIPAPAFRNACISACRLVGFKMTMAKLSIFVEADGFGRDDGQPLVKIIGSAPRQFESMVRLANGSCDISVRPQWIEWGARLRIRYDADQFTASDVVNLVARAGLQVGICEGRPGSTNSNGMGWGTFEVSTKEDVIKLEKKGAKK